MAKTAVQMFYDKNTGAAAAVFCGNVQAFPQHFHDYYVIGITEKGLRSLLCSGRKYLLSRGAVSIFCPGESHSCADVMPGPFCHKSFNLPTQLVETLLPDGFDGFGSSVLYNVALFKHLSAWHTEFCQSRSADGRWTLLRKIIKELAEAGGTKFVQTDMKRLQTVNDACCFINANYGRHFSMSELCQSCGVSASTLLRYFTVVKGMTPQQYLTAVRINTACKMLQKGTGITETALAGGFSSQSHFTNTFTKIIGITPKAYSNLFLQRGGNLFDG